MRRKLSGTGWAQPQRRRRAIVIVALVAFTTLTFGASTAWGSFPSSPTLDNFTLDASLNPNWTTPALGDNEMQLDPALHDLVGTGGTWAAARWMASFSNPVEAWATIYSGGVNDAVLYGDVAGGGSGAAHPTGGYFADFGGSASVGSPSEVSIWRINGVNNETKLTVVPAPYSNLQAGDQIGLSINKGVIIAWYRPSGRSWSAVVSTVDSTYTNGRIAIEAIPGDAYGFSVFGGGTPSAPVRSKHTTTSIAASASSLTIRQHVTYTATVAPTPRVPRGTVAFLDRGRPIPGCIAKTINGKGKATCSVTYNAPATHAVRALYTGSLNGAFAGSRATLPAIVRVTALPEPSLRVGRSRLILTIACPPKSKGCGISSTISVALPGVTGVITIGKFAATLTAGKSKQVTVALDGRTQAKLRLYIGRHHLAHLGIAVHLVLVEGNGTREHGTFTYTISSGRVLAQL
jgi:Bacterial Ig-like domain (group 3)